MKPMMMIGIALIILGVVGLIFQGISYTTREKVVDLGGLQVTAEKEKTIPIPAILGALALAGGIAMVVVTSRKKGLLALLLMGLFVAGQAACVNINRGPDDSARKETVVGGNKGVVVEHGGGEGSDVRIGGHKGIVVEHH